MSPTSSYRIALARVFLHDPSIVIIEEPTSPLDDEIKPLMDDTIDRLAKGRTLIFLPHRLSTIRRVRPGDRPPERPRRGHRPPANEVYARNKLYRHIQYVEFGLADLAEASS